MYEYTAVVEKVHDGDTITIDLDLGMYHHHTPTKVRMIGINAPEISTGAAGKASRESLISLLKTKDQPLYGKDYVEPVTIYVATIKVADHELFDAYGRVLGWIYLSPVAMAAKDRESTLNWQQWLAKQARAFMIPKDWPVAK
jgi:hypothetical protein